MPQNAPSTARSPDLFGYDPARERRAAASLERWRKTWARGGLRAALPKGQGYHDATHPGAEKTLPADWIGSHPGGAVVQVTTRAWLDLAPGIGDLVALCGDPQPSAENQEVRRVMAVQEDLFDATRFLMLGPVLTRRAWPKALRAAIPARARRPTKAGAVHAAARRSRKASAAEPAL